MSESANAGLKRPDPISVAPLGGGGGPGPIPVAIGAQGHGIAPASPADRRVGHRKLHIRHIAFMRAVVQGLDPRQSWDRYLRTEGNPGDARQVRSTLHWIRDEFAAAAKRHGRFATARLVRLDLERAAAAAKASGRAKPPSLSLEEFALERGLEDFSHAEQLEAYTEYLAEQGDDARADLKRSRRRERIVQRQLEALSWLEQLVAEPPAAADPVSAWLNPDLARRLEAGGILTLQQLADRINGIGRRWYVPLRALGTTKAQRIEAWMRDHELTTGLVLGSHTAMPRKAVDRRDLNAVVRPATAIRPLNKLYLPPALDGSLGANRQPAQMCRVDAVNDIQAIAIWLGRLGQGGTVEPKISNREWVPAPPCGGPGAFGDRVSISGVLDAASSELSATQRCYRKEAERLLLWAVLVRQKPLSSLTAEDCAAYVAFLADPQPRDRWCGPRSRERWSPLWRPFEGPLGAAAQRAARVALSQLFEFLLDHGYVENNPWRAVRSSPRQPAPRKSSPRLPHGQHHSEAIELQQQPSDSRTVRLVWVLRLMAAGRLSPREASSATVDDLRWAEDRSHSANDLTGCILTVRGPGARTREVHLPPAAVEALRQHLVDRGLSRDITSECNRGAYLVGRVCDVDARQPGAAAMLRATGRHGKAHAAGSKGGEASPEPAGMSHRVPDLHAFALAGISAHTLYGVLRRFREQRGSSSGS